MNLLTYITDKSRGRFALPASSVSSSWGEPLPYLCLIGSEWISYPLLKQSPWWEGWLGWWADIGGGITPGAMEGESLPFMWTESGEGVVPQMKILFLGYGEDGRRQWWFTINMHPTLSTSGFGCPSEDGVRSGGPPRCMKVTESELFELEGLL